MINYLQTSKLIISKPISYEHRQGSYAESLIDPAHVIAGVPDAYCCPTAKISQRNVLTPPGLTAWQAIIVRPTAEKCVGHGYSSRIENVQSFNMSNFDVIPASKNAGTANEEFIYTSSDPVQQEHLDDVSIYPFGAKITSTSNFSQIPILPPVSLTTPTVLPHLYIDLFGYAHPYSISSAFLYTLEITGQLDNNTGLLKTTGDPVLQIAFQCYTTAGAFLGYTGVGNIVLQDDVYIASTQLVTLSIVNSLFGSSPYASTAYMRPVLRAADPGMPFTPRSFKYTLSNSAPVQLVDTNQIVVDTWYDVLNMKTLTRDCSKFRTVSQSLLLSYVGAQLSGGIIYAANIMDGSHWADLTKAILTVPSTALVSNAIGIANIPQSYSGSVIDGLYGVYRPQSLEMATKWHKFSEEYDFSLPYQAVLFKCVDVSALIRIEVVTNFELMTVSPLYTMEVTPADYNSMFAALQALHRLPLFVQNESHLDHIKNVLRFLYNSRQAIAQGIGMAVGRPDVGIAAGAALALLPNWKKDVKEEVKSEVRKSLNTASGRGAKGTTRVVRPQRSKKK